MPRRHQKMPGGHWGLLPQECNTSDFSTGVLPQNKTQPTFGTQHLTWHLQRPAQLPPHPLRAQHSSHLTPSVPSSDLTFLFVSSSSSILAPPASLRTGLSRGDEPWVTAFKFTWKAGVKPRGLFSTREESWEWSTGRPGWEDNKKTEWKRRENYFKDSANKVIIHCYSKPELQSHIIFKKVKEKEKKDIQIQRFQCVSQSKGSVPCIPEVTGQCSKDRQGPPQFREG